MIPEEGTRIRPTRPGAYVWTDHERDVNAALEPHGSPGIVGALSIVRENGISAGILIDRGAAEDIIGWLQDAIATEGQRP